MGQLDGGRLIRRGAGCARQPELAQSACRRRGQRRKSHPAGGIRIRVDEVVHGRQTRLFLVDDRCGGETVAAGGSCTVSVGAAGASDSRDLYATQIFENSDQLRPLASLDLVLSRLAGTSGVFSDPPDTLVVEGSDAPVDRVRSVVVAMTNIPIAIRAKCGSWWSPRQQRQARKRRLWRAVSITRQGSRAPILRWQSIATPQAAGPPTPAATRWPYCLGRPRRSRTGLNRAAQAPEGPAPLRQRY